MTIAPVRDRWERSMSEGTDFGKPSDSWTLVDVADCTVMRKLKWLFVNGCEFNDNICVATEFLNSCQGGTDASLCFGIMLKKLLYMGGINELRV
jgi:hypothetical protein